MKISRVENNKKRYISLLLLADEQESMIDRYLQRGELFVLSEGDEAVAVAVITNEGNGVCELKNLAVTPKRQRCGCGQRMIEYLAEASRARYHTMLVGTGDCPGVLSFYNKCGFREDHRISGFFTDNYDHPIIEDGVQLVDMVVLKRPLWMLETERLGFRCLSHNDSGALRPILGDIETMYAWEYGFSDEQIAEWIDKNILRYKNDGYACFAAVCKNTGELIGTIGLINEELSGKKYIGLSYIIAKWHWGMGYATEGAQKFLTYAFNTLDANQVVADIRPENKASRRVAERLGMSIIGEHLKIHNGKKMQHMVYCIDKKAFDMQH